MMATYEVTIEGKGTYEVTSDNDLTDAQAYQYALEQSKSEVTPSAPAKKLTREEAIKEITSYPRPEQMQIGSAKDLGRQLGLTGRAALTGALSIPTMGADALTGLINILAGRQVMQPTSQALQNLMTQAGVPTPQNPQERVVQDVTSAGFGVAGPASIAKYFPVQASTEYNIGDMCPGSRNIRSRPSQAGFFGSCFNA